MGYTDLVLRFIEPVHERQDAARKTGRETAAEEEVAEVGLTVEAVINDCADACADQPIRSQSQISLHSASQPRQTFRMRRMKDRPSNPDIINPRTKIHAMIMRTSGHGMPHDAAEQTYEREDGEDEERSVDVEA